MQNTNPPPLITRSLCPTIKLLRILIFKTVFRKLSVLSKFWEWCIWQQGWGHLVCVIMTHCVRKSIYVAQPLTTLHSVTKFAKKTVISRWKCMAKVNVDEFGKPWILRSNVLPKNWITISNLWPTYNNVSQCQIPVNLDNIKFWNEICQKNLNGKK